MTTSEGLKIFTFETLIVKHSHYFKPHIIVYKFPYEIKFFSIFFCFNSSPYFSEYLNTRPLVRQADFHITFPDETIRIWKKY